MRPIPQQSKRRTVGVWPARRCPFGVGFLSVRTAGWLALAPCSEPEPCHWDMRSHLGKLAFMAKSERSKTEVQVVAAYCWSGTSSFALGS